MEAAARVEITVALELVNREFADRFEHPETRLPVGVVPATQQTVREQRADALVEDLPRTTSVASNDSAASRRKPPTKTPSRANSCWSTWGRSSKLQAIVAMSVCWRGSASSAPPDRNCSRLSRRLSIVFGGSTRTRAAASSTASGSPSRRRHTSATATALRSSIVNSGSTACARRAKSRTASELRIASGPSTATARQAAAGRKVARRGGRAAPGS